MDPSPTYAELSKAVRTHKPPLFPNQYNNVGAWFIDYKTVNDNWITPNRNYMVEMPVQLKFANDVNKLDVEHLNAFMKLWSIDTRARQPIRQLQNRLNSGVPNLEWQWFKYDEMILLFEKDVYLREEYIDYTYSGYIQTNESLRKEPEGCIEEDDEVSEPRVIQALSGITRVLDKPAVVYRFVGTDDLLENITGGELMQHGYTSTSVSLTYVWKHTVRKAKSPTERHRTIMEIRLPAGTHCTIVPSEEYELILPYNSRLKLITQITLPRIYHKGVEVREIPYMVFDLVNDGVC